MEIDKIGGNQIVTMQFLINNFILQISQAKIKIKSQLQFMFGSIFYASDVKYQIFLRNIYVKWYMQCTT